MTMLRRGRRSPIGLRCRTSALVALRGTQGLLGDTAAAVGGNTRARLGSRLVRMPAGPP